MKKIIDTKKDKSMNICPHCNKNDCVPYVAIANAEAYGGSHFKLKCKHCKKPIIAGLSRKVVVSQVLESKHKSDDCDFSDSMMFR